MVTSYKSTMSPIIESDMYKLAVCSTCVANSGVILNADLNNESVELNVNSLESKCYTSPRSSSDLV